MLNDDKTKMFIQNLTNDSFVLEDAHFLRNHYNYYDDRILQQMNYIPANYNSKLTPSVLNLE